MDWLVDRWIGWWIDGLVGGSMDWLVDRWMWIDGLN
jgi:hypothetical protein